MQFPATLRRTTGHAVFLIAAGLLTLPAAADTISWSGNGTDNNWSTGANWVGNVAPGDGDTVVLGNDAFDTAQTINLDVDVAPLLIQQAATGNRDYTIDTSNGSTFTTHADTGYFFNINGGNTNVTINPDIVLDIGASVGDVVNFRVATGSTLTLNGVLSGDSGIQAVGTGTIDRGTVKLTNANTFGGEARLFGGQGEFHVGNPSALGSDTLRPISGNGGGTVSLSSDIALPVIQFSSDGSTLTLRINEASSPGRTFATGWLRETFATQAIILAANPEDGTGHLTLAMDSDLAVTVRDAQLNITTIANSTLAFTGSTWSQELEGVVSGDGALHVQNTAADVANRKLTITSSNTFTGGTTLAAGILEARANSALGTGGVAVAAGAVLDIGGAGISDVIDDLALLSLDEDAGSYALVALSTGVNEIVGSLVLDGVAQGAGTYGSTASAATYQNDNYFSGDGIITVVPEPASAALLGLGGVLVAGRRRR